jgi:hypothetical protein
MDRTLGSDSGLRNVHVQGEKFVGVVFAGLLSIFSSASLWIARRSGY